MEVTVSSTWRSTVVVPGHNFGLVSAVTNFNSVPEFTTFVAASSRLIPTDHMFDDVVTVDRAEYS